METLNLIFSIVGAVGVIFIGISVLLARRQHLFSRTYEVYERLDSNEARAARRYTRHDWNGDINILRNKYYRNLVHRHINDLDVVGSLYARGYIDNIVIATLFGGMIVDSWKKCGEYIMSHRRNSLENAPPFPFFACHFEAMVKSLSKKAKWHGKSMVKLERSFRRFAKKYNLDIPG